MNANRLLRAIRVYAGKSTKDFANILGIANSSVTNIASTFLNKNTPLFLAGYY